MSPALLLRRGLWRGGRGSPRSHPRRRGAAAPPGTCSSASGKPGCTTSSIVSPPPTATDLHNCSILQQQTDKKTQDSSKLRINPRSLELIQLSALLKYGNYSSIFRGVFTSQKSKLFSYFKLDFQIFRGPKITTPPPKKKIFFFPFF